jgi:hypothetical protein
MGCGGGGGERVETQRRWKGRHIGGVQAQEAAGFAMSESKWEAQAEQRDPEGVSVAVGRRSVGRPVAVT